jgi:hypothetical protein
MVLDIPTLHVLTVLALVGTGRSIWAIAVGREEMVYPSWPAASAPDRLVPRPAGPGIRGRLGVGWAPRRSALRHWPTPATLRTASRAGDV